MFIWPGLSCLLRYHFVAVFISCEGRWSTTVAWWPQSSYECVLPLYWTVSFAVFRPFRMSWNHVHLHLIYNAYCVGEQPPDSSPLCTSVELFDWEFLSRLQSLWQSAWTVHQWFRIWGQRWQLEDSCGGGGGPGCWVRSPLCMCLFAKTHSSLMLLIAALL